MRRLWLLGLAAALLTTACRIETNVLLNIDADRSGSLGIELGMDEEFRQLVAGQGEGFDIDAIFGGIDTDLPGSTVTQRTEGDMMFSIVTIPFEDEEAFRQLMAQADGDGGDMNVVWEDDKVTVEAFVEGTGDLGFGGLGPLGDLGDAAGDLGDDFDLGGDLDFAGDLGGGFAGLAESFFSASFIVGLPGEVTEHNAGRVLSDGRLQWDVPFDGSDLSIRAVSDTAGGSGFPAWAVVLLLLAAAAALLWWYSTQRNRRAVAAVEAAAAASEGTPAPPTDWSAGGAESGDGPSTPGDAEAPG